VDQPSFAELAAARTRPSITVSRGLPILLSVAYAEGSLRETLQAELRALQARLN